MPPPARRAAPVPPDLETAVTHADTFCHPRAAGGGPAGACRGRAGGRALVFARNALRHPRLLGAVAPSSRHLVRRLVAPVCVERARVLVEYGPGLGAATGEILRRMRPDARLVALEANPEFVAYLRADMRDPRLSVVHASAEDVLAVLAGLGVAGADGIVSGLPLAIMPREVRARILRATRAALAPGATFSLYQYTRAALPELRATFGPVRERLVVRNLPPAWVFWCRAPEWAPAPHPAPHHPAPDPAPPARAAAQAAPSAR